MKEKVILDPSFRRMANILLPEDLARMQATADILWARDEPMPDEEIDGVRSEVSVVISSGWRYGDVARCLCAMMAFR
jgi:hypothetical protein